MTSARRSNHLDICARSICTYLYKVNYFDFFIKLNSYYSSVSMANIYLKKKLYHEIIKRGFDPTQYVNQIISEKLKEMSKNEDI